MRNDRFMNVLPRGVRAAVVRERLLYSRLQEIRLRVKEAADTHI